MLSFLFIYLFALFFWGCCFLFLLFFCMRNPKLYIYDCIGDSDWSYLFLGVKQCATMLPTWASYGSFQTVINHRAGTQPRRNTSMKQNNSVNSQYFTLMSSGLFTIFFHDWYLFVLPRCQKSKLEQSGLGDLWQHLYSCWNHMLLSPGALIKFGIQLWKW